MGRYGKLAGGTGGAACPNQEFNLYGKSDKIIILIYLLYLIYDLKSSFHHHLPMEGIPAYLQISVRIS